MPSHASIDQMILNILYNPADHHIFTYQVDEQLVGFGHLAHSDQSWELAVSVEYMHQGKGIANALMAHMIVWAKTHDIDTVFMHCISQNTKIQHLARKHGLTAVTRSGQDITAHVQLPEPTVLDYTHSLIQEQTELATDIVRMQRTWIQKWINPN